MKKILSFILMIITLVGCSYDYNINKLEQEKLEYSRLPLKLQKFMYSIPEYNPYQKDILIVDSIDVNRYHVEEIKTIVGPWIAFFVLLDDKKENTYRIDRELATPYIIYADKLYIPDRYNIFCEEDFRNAIYTVYQLKELKNC